MTAISDLFVTGQSASAHRDIEQQLCFGATTATGTFTNWTGQKLGLGGEGATTGVTLSDINSDRASRFCRYRFRQRAYALPEPA